MKIGEQATAYAHEHQREFVLQQAQGALHRISMTPVDELIAGRDVAWLLAAAMLKDVINGSGPRVITRVMDDHCAVGDKLG